MTMGIYIILSIFMVGTLFRLNDIYHTLKDIKDALEQKAGYSEDNADTTLVRKVGESEREFFFRLWKR